MVDGSNPSRPTKFKSASVRKGPEDLRSKVSAALICSQSGALDADRPKLRSLKAKAKVYRIADSNGLAIEVRPASLKFWRYLYRFAGKSNMLVLGEYPTQGLADARAARDKARAQLKAGVKPMRAAQAQKAAECSGNSGHAC